MKSTIRIMKSPDITSEATVIVVLTTDDKVIEAKMPIHAFTHAVMGVAGIDCEVSEKERHVVNNVTNELKSNKL